MIGAIIASLCIGFVFGAAFVCWAGYRAGYLDEIKVGGTDPD